MKSAEQWIDEIENSIAYLRNKNIRTYANFYIELEKDAPNKIKNHFSKEYNIQIHKCPRQRYDLIITW